MSLLSEPRVLDRRPVTSVSEYQDGGGGRGLEASRRLGAAATVEELEASGLRGRGGAGFPTGRKWRTVLENASPLLPATVIVNAAEGEPGSFKDRAILRANPYRVLEGALIAARTVGADTVVVAMKAKFETELARVRAALDEIKAVGWADGLSLVVAEGPSHYLYGEETALLEVLSGRNPFPRVSPPFRHGLDEAGPHTRSAADDPMAGPGDDLAAAPTLINNVETFANVPLVLAEGPQWFRSLGTSDTPGTVVCTITGDTVRHGVGEVPTDTPLREVIDAIGGGVRPGRRVSAVISGVANAMLPGSRLDTLVSHQAMQDAGSGLGAAGFLVFDDTTHPVAVAAGVSRFLAVESCGQCTPCKQDGLALSELLGALIRAHPDESEANALPELVATVSDEARCFLAHQHQRVVASLLELFPDELRAAAAAGSEGFEPVLIAPIDDLSGEAAVLDAGQTDKQPDWTHDATYSGQSPADRIKTGTDLL